MALPSTPGGEVDYNDWGTYDYPSIGQIAELLRSSEIIPIFASVENIQPIYDVSHQIDRIKTLFMYL